MRDANGIKPHDISDFTALALVNLAGVNVDMPSISKAHQDQKSVAQAID
jgi:hypothetical protein